MPYTISYNVDMPTHFSLTHCACVRWHGTDRSHDTPMHPKFSLAHGLVVTGDVAVGLTDERGVDVPVNTIDNKDGTFTVEYEPKTPGMYTVMVYFADKEIPQSPIKVKVEPSIDVSGIKVEGLEPSESELLCLCIILLSGHAEKLCCQCIHDMLSYRRAVMQRNYAVRAVMICCLIGEW